MTAAEASTVMHKRVKDEARLQARAALAGFTLEKQADGTWLAGRWGHFRPLADAAAVERFLRAVGAPE